MTGKQIPSISICKTKQLIISNTFFSLFSFDRWLKIFCIDKLKTKLKNIKTLDAFHRSNRRTFHRICRNEQIFVHWNRKNNFKFESHQFFLYSPMKFNRWLKHEIRFSAEMKLRRWSECLKPKTKTHLAKRGFHLSDEVWMKVESVHLNYSVATLRQAPDDFMNCVFFSLIEISIRYLCGWCVCVCEYDAVSQIKCDQF